MTLTRKLLLALFDGFSIQRWLDLVRPCDFSQMDKEGERLMVAFILARYEEARGEKVDWDDLIHGSLFDYLEKLALCDIKAPVQRLLQDDYKNEYIKLQDWVLSTYKTLLGDDALFSRFTIYTGQKAGSYTLPATATLSRHILKASSRITSYRELQILRAINESERVEKIESELLSELQEYLDLEGVKLILTHQQPYHFLIKAESLRFQVRWNGAPRVPPTTVMGHSFFTAILTLFLLRMYPKAPDEKLFANTFFCALFHDLPESVTRDIISPVKSATKQLPSVIKGIEGQIVEKELAPFMDEAYKSAIMAYTSDEFSDRQSAIGAIDGRTVRIADHLCALLEADASINYGIKSPHFARGIKTLMDTYKKADIINGINVRALFQAALTESE